jgi:hypothetical protein
MGEAQTAAHVLMIRPVRFTANAETAPSNRFQQSVADDEQGLQAAALGEFETLKDTLVAAGVGASVFDDSYELYTPDAVFPNNWVSFHADGTVILYPMLAPNRRLERRPELLQALQRQGFHIGQIIDLSPHEVEQRYLEGTGSLVLDRTHRIAYACLSPRTHAEVLGEFARHMNYELMVFEASDATGAAIYHTNVMLSIGRRLAVVCAASVRADQRQRLLQTLQAHGRTVLQLSEQQMQAFAGNVLELRTRLDEPVIVISERAYASLDEQQRSILATLGGRILSVAIPTIERVGGGSVRCMLAEIHLPSANASSPPSAFS